MGRLSWLCRLDGLIRNPCRVVSCVLLITDIETLLYRIGTAKTLTLTPRKSPFPGIQGLCIAACVIDAHHAIAPVIHRLLAIGTQTVERGTTQGRQLTGNTH